MSRYFFAVTVILMSYFLAMPHNAARSEFYGFSAPLEESPENTLREGMILDMDISVLKEINKAITEDGRDISYYPEEILFFDGKRVRIRGHFLLPMMASQREPCDEFGVSLYGLGCSCCTGTPPPSAFNVVIVKMPEGREVEPIFSPYIEVTGTFRCKKEYYQFGENKQLAALFFLEGEDHRKFEPKLWQKILGVR